MPWESRSDKLPLPGSQSFASLVLGILFACKTLAFHEEPKSQRTFQSVGLLLGDVQAC